MTVVSGELYAHGLRQVRVYALDSNGYIDAPAGGNVYEGIQLEGAKVWTPTLPDNRLITHYGDDKVLAQDYLPPIEGATGTLTLARHDPDAHIVFTGELIQTLGETKLIGWGTSQQGNENDVGLFFYQAAKDAVNKLSRWRYHVLPVTKVIPKPAPMGEGPSEFNYNILMEVATAHLWGTAFVLGTDGFTTAQILEGMAEDIPHIVGWQGDGTQTVFLFHTDRQASATTKIHEVTEDGVSVSETEAVTGITFATAPADGAIIACIYEYAA